MYNAKSDFWNKYLDVAHKIISPSSYSCDLCSLTYGNFSEKKAWKAFRENTDYDFVFMYKDEFLKKYSLKEEAFKFPVILEKEKEAPRLFLDVEALSKLHSVEELIKILEKKIA